MKKKEKIIITPYKKMLIYMVAVSWLFMVAAVSYAVVKDTENAGEIIKAFSKTASLWEAVFRVF